MSESDESAEDRRSPRVAGIVLAAGTGSRLGVPKSLVRLADGRLLTTRAIQTLREAGVGSIHVVLGASEYTARTQLAADIGRNDDVTVVSNPEHAEGIASSVRAGLRSAAAEEAPADAVVMLLADMPRVHPEAVAKLAAYADPAVLAVATWEGRPVHPMLFGREHWEPIASAVQGDVGARSYLTGRSDVRLVPCDGLGSPEDLDTPEDLARLAAPEDPVAEIVRAEVTTEEIQVGYLQLLVQDNRSGAVVSFDGTVRDHDHGRIVEDLHYLQHPSADQVMKKIAGRAAKMSGVRAIAIEHRVGQLRVGETAFGCVVSAEHRAQAFDACRWLVEEVKAHLPIWKRQVFADGTDEWVNSP